MNRLIDYILEKQDLNLTLQIKWDKYLGWFIYVREYGHTTPLVCVTKDGKEEAFDLAYGALKVKLEGHL